MKKVLLLTMLFAFAASVSSFASSNKYRIDDNVVEAALTTGVSVIATDIASNPLLDVQKATAQLEDKNVWIAVLLDVLIGGLAIHRVYLGGSPVLIVGYLLTCGGIFGLIPLIDFIVLIINNQDISKYVDNDAFFMW